ncbi:MAG: Rnf-Nqr domain containing protein [Alkalispirochaetaceae bacterium]
MTIRDGLFRENPLIARLAGLAPALMVSTHLIYGFVIGLGVVVVSLASTATLYPLRRYLLSRSALTASFLVMATYVTLFSRVLELTNPYIHDKLWIYLPILAVNCVILYSTRLRGESFGEILAGGFGRALGYAGALLFISALREILAFGTLSFSLSLEGGQVVTLLPGGPLRLVGHLAGGFMLLGYLRALYQKQTMNSTREGEET